MRRISKALALGALSGVLASNGLKDKEQKDDQQ